MGVAFFRMGFRPFFLGAGVSAVSLVSIWILAQSGLFSQTFYFPPSDWHAHEMIFGMASAVIAGFILTAVPNWTGRNPLQGWPLMGLFGLWLGGRIAVSVDFGFKHEGIAVIDSAFLVMLFVYAFREVLTGRNWRNMPVVVAIGALASANCLTHFSTLGIVTNDGLGNRMGIAVVVGLITLIGGRIIPAFTRNWLVKKGNQKLPKVFGKFDIVVLGFTMIALVTWVGLPDERLVGVMLLTAGLLNAVRLTRWQGLRTIKEPLVWSMHLGYSWIPVGMFLLGGSYFWSGLSQSVGIHALTVGAIGAMVLAIMTRATLGHTGRALAADKLSTVIYVFVFVAALARVATPIFLDIYQQMLLVSATAWCAAFGIFCWRYGKLLVCR